MEAESPEAARLALERRRDSGASWFYWIAGLSLVNSVMQLFGSTRSFIAGLGITQVVDAMTREAGDGAKAGAFVFDLLVAGVFVAAGVLARRSRSAFIAGMALYALDGLIFLLVREWIGLAFHAFVLYSIFSGYRAALALRDLPPAAGEPVSPRPEAAGVPAGTLPPAQVSAPPPPVSSESNVPK